MTREHHLSYCNICKLKEKNLNKGLCCSLTNELADFNNSCPTFKFDNTEYKKFKKRFEDEVKEAYDLKGIEAFLSDSMTFIKPSKSRNPKYKSINETHNLKFKNNIRYDKKAIWMLGFAFIVTLAYNYKKLLNGTDTNLILITLSAIVLIIAFAIYSAYFKEFKPEISISISKSGIEYENKKLRWNNILDYGILKSSNSRGSYKTIIIGTISKGIVEIDITDLNFSPDDFINIIRLNTEQLIHHKE